MVLKPKSKNIRIKLKSNPTTEQYSRNRTMMNSVRLSNHSPINDPLFIKLDCEDFGGYMASRSNLTFAITNESFLPLVDRDYNLRCVTDKRFSATISKSCYRYAMCMHLYRRYAQIRHLNGLGEGDELKLLRYMNTKSYVTPPAIESYLRGIGDFQHPNGCHYHLDTPAWPNCTGDFGRVDAKTHWKYMSFPAPRVVAEAVVADLRYTTGIIKSKDWNLPEDLRPISDDNYDPGLPTINLLGWNQAIKLTSNQRMHVESTGITIDAFEGEGRFCLNKTLIEKVHDSLNNSSTKMRLGTGICEHSFGSVGQMIWCQRDCAEQSTYSRNQRYLEFTIRGLCGAKVDPNIVIISLIYNLRVKKDNYMPNTSNERRVWSIYDWNEYASVPDTWNETRNSVFNWKDSERLNTNEKFTSFSERNHFYTALVRKSLIVRET